VTDLLAPTLAAEAASAFAAFALARRRSDHRPVAIAFVCMILAHLARLVLVRELGPASVDPYRGAKLVLVYLDGALVLASLAIVPALGGERRAEGEPRGHSHHDVAARRGLLARRARRGHAAHDGDRARRAGTAARGDARAARGE
jgi:hypothetical protein